MLQELQQRLQVFGNRLCRTRHNGLEMPCFACGPKPVDYANAVVSNTMKIGGQHPVCNIREQGLHLEAPTQLLNTIMPAADTDGSRRKSKVLMLLIDGLGDVTLPVFGDRTPLGVAHVPILDAIAAGGLNGLLDPVEPGLACGSDTAHMSIFGYDPRIHYRGRGAFESMGAGIAMAPGDIAFKSNFATLDPATGVVLRRRADRNFEHLGPTLCAALDGLRLPSFPQHTVRVQYATEHRCGIALSGPGLSDAVSGTDPLKDALPLLAAGPLDESPEALHTAAVVNELSQEMRRVLAGHPINAERAASGLAVANVVLLRGCGARICVPTFQQLHGMKPCLVAPTKIIAGLGMSFGIDALEAPGGTGAYNSAFHAKATTACDALVTGGYDFAFVHVKAVDDAGHDRKVQMKVRFLEVVDKMMGQILRRLADDEVTAGGARYSLVVLGDHSTPIVFGDHSHEPVPFAIAHVQHVVEALGGPDALLTIRPGTIPLPDPEQPPPMSELNRQAVFEDARRKSAWAGRGWDAMMPTELFGPGRTPWPQVVKGDVVRSFDEVSAARGALGRFPGLGVMTLVKQFAGWEAATRPAAAAPVGLPGT